MHFLKDLKDEDCVEVKNLKQNKIHKLNAAWVRSTMKTPGQMEKYDILGPCDKTKAISTPAAVAAAVVNDLRVAPIKQEAPPEKEETAPEISSGKPSKEEIEACNDTKQLKKWAESYGVDLGQARALKKIKEALINGI